MMIGDGMKENIRKILLEQEKNNNYIIDNYTLEQRIDFLKQLELLAGQAEFSDYFDDYFERNTEHNFKVFNSEESLKILLDKISKEEKLQVENFVDYFMMLNLNDDGYKILFEYYSDLLSSYHIFDIITTKIENLELKLHYYHQFKEVFTDFEIVNYLNMSNNNFIPEKLKVEFYKKIKESIILKGLNGNISSRINWKEFISSIIIPEEKLFFIFKLFEDGADIYDFGNDYGSVVLSNLLNDVLLFCSDEIKLKVFNKFWSKMPNVKYFSNLVCSITNDIKKEELFNFILNSKEMKFSKGELLMDLLLSLKDEELKMQIFNSSKEQLINSSNIEVFFKKIKTDSFREKIFEQFEKTNSFLESTIYTFEDDTMKLDYLKRYRSVINVKVAVKIITSLKSDNLKIHIINNNNNNNNNFKILERINIIKSINDIDLRMEMMVNEAINKKNFGWLHECICHDEELLGCKKINDDLIKFYASQNSLNYENLKILVEKYGYVFLRYYNNENILKIINCGEEEFKKLMLLFDNEEFTKLNESLVDSIYDSLIKKVFKIVRKDIGDLYVDIKSYSEKKDVENLTKILTMISCLVDFKKYEIDINQLISSLLDDEKREVSLVKVGEIVKQYRIKKANSYLNKRKQKKGVDLKLTKKFERTYFMKKLLLNLDDDGFEKLKIIIKNIDLNKLDNKSVELLKDENIISEYIKFKMDPQNYKGNLDVIRPHMKQFNIIFEFLYNTQYNELLKLLTKELDENHKIVDYSNLDSEKIIKIFIELDIDLLKDKLFSNDDLFKELSNVLSKYKILGWNDIFEKLIKEAKVDFDDATIASLIQFFYRFYPEMNEDRKKDLFEIIKDADYYTPGATIYASLLGEEDYRWLSRNPIPNAPQMKKKERLESVPGLLKKMYQRKFITIPSMKENIKICEGKSLNVTIGNTTDTINFTYGERTGACMRIGGHADSLLRFCIENENGFHIMITNPETGELVSRVSGFRNGNTIILNQLRHSLDSRYSDLELVDLMKKVSKIIIDRTKDSEYPIDNVFINSEYAMKVSGENCSQISEVEDFQEGYSDFYMDTKINNAILLASSNADNSLVDLKLGPSNVEKYPILRQKIRCITDKKEIVRNIKKINAIDKLLIDDDNWMQICFEEIDVDNISKLFVGEDWYIALDEKDNIIGRFYIDRGLEETLEEMNFVTANFISNSQDMVEKGFVI